MDRNSTSTALDDTPLRVLSQELPAGLPQASMDVAPELFPASGSCVNHSQRDEPSDE